MFVSRDEVAEPVWVYWVGCGWKYEVDDVDRAGWVGCQVWEGR